MRQALPLALAALLLSGCASHKPEDFNGTWINQDAIDAAAEGGSLRQALRAHGPVFEWKLDIDRQQASFTNGFEAGDGQLSAVGDEWEATFLGNYIERIRLSGDELRVTDPNGKIQNFVKPKEPASADSPLGGSFEKALYKAYMGGEWKIIEGQGSGGVVHFADNGSVTGLPGSDRYALCMEGDCSSMGGENDNMWLERNQRGKPFIFKRDGDKLEIFQAVNSGPADGIGQLSPGVQQWVLEKD